MQCEFPTTNSSVSRGAQRTHTWFGILLPTRKRKLPRRDSNRLPSAGRCHQQSPIGHVAHDSASAGLESSSRGFLHSRQPSLRPCGHRSSLTQLRTCSFTQRSTNRLASQMLGSQCAPPTPACLKLLGRLQILYDIKWLFGTAPGSYTNPGLNLNTYAGDMFELA